MGPGWESAGCPTGTQTLKTWRRHCAVGKGPSPGTLLRSGAAGRPARSKDAGGAGGCYTPACRRCGTS